MKIFAVSMLAVAGLAASVQAQTYEGGTGAGGASVDFQVWNGSSWANNANINPGDQVEWRVVVSYTGTRQDLFAMGELLMQPYFGGVDNVGAGALMDNAFGGQGVNSGNGIPLSMLPITDRANSSALGAYGRIAPFGATSMQTNATAANGNQMQLYRHSGGSAGAPAGDWIRFAGGSGAVNTEVNETWADSLAATAASTNANNLNRINRGLSSAQTSQALAAGNHTSLMYPADSQLSGLVVFRGAFVASSELPTLTDRVVTLNSDASFSKRVGSTTSADNRRYMSWQTGAGDTGTGITGHRTGLVFDGATITILLPTPGSVALLGLGGLIVARRRRA